MSDKTGWKGRGQQLRDSNWARRDRIPSPGSAKKNNYALEFPEGYIVLRGRELKRKFRLRTVGTCGDSKVEHVERVRVCKSFAFSEKRSARNRGTANQRLSGRIHMPVWEFTQQRPPHSVRPASPL